MKKYLFILIIMVLMSAFVSAEGITDISYYYTLGIASESVADFAEASTNYKDCYEIASEDSEIEWYELCKSAYDRSSSVTTTKTKELVSNIPWEFKGEYINDETNSITQYYLTSNDELVIIDVFEVDFDLNDDDLKSFVEYQKSPLEGSYGLSSDEIKIDGLNVYYLLGEDKEEPFTIFNGFVYLSEENSVYNIRATLNDENLDSFFNDLKFNEESSSLVLIGVLVFLVVVVVGLVIYTRKFKK